MANVELKKRIYFTPTSGIFASARKNTDLTKTSVSDYLRAATFLQTFFGFFDGYSKVSRAVKQVSSLSPAT